jgi:DNA-directed RNA polymerase subunit RPC12/RpoP
MGVDSAFLRKENKLLDMKVKCATCGSKIQVFINDMSSAGEV